MSELFAMIWCIGYIGAILAFLYVAFLHEIVSIVIGGTFCRKKKRCQNRNCLFLMGCGKYSAPKPDYPPRKRDE